jgi:hypothetical protein
MLVYQWYWSRPLWVDEEMIALNIRDRTLAELIGALWMNQSAPLGWLWAQRLVIVSFGTTERALRALPVLFGLATLTGALAIGRAWMRPLGAAVLALLCAFGLSIAFFPLEAKPYSADVFFGLLMPVLAWWAMRRPLTGSPGNLNGPRIWIWCAVAAAAQWMANGALFAAVASALVMGADAFRRKSWNGLAQIAVPGLLCALSFALHYYLALRYSFENESLQSYWAPWMPPSEGGIAATMRWLGSRFETLANDPGGSRMWLGFWLSAAGGLALSAASGLSAAWYLASLPALAFLLGALRLVPLGGRLTLWAVVALYAGIALMADYAACAARRAFSARNWVAFTLAALATVAVLRVSWDIFHRGEYEFRVRPSSNHALDDRAAMRFLMAQRQQGDVLVTARMALPAVWWYGGIDLRPPHLGRTVPGDGSPILELRHYWPGPDCVPSKLSATLVGVKRVALYLGFDSRQPPGLQELTLDRLSELGAMVAYRGIAEEGVAAVFDLTRPPAPWTVIVTGLSGHQLPTPERARGCVGFHPAARW